MCKLHKNMTLREAVKYAEKLGIEVAPKHRTGELKFVRKDGVKYVRNRRQKDAGRGLISFLQQAGDL